MSTVFILEIKTGRVMAAEYKGGILNFPGYVVFWKHAWTGGDSPPKGFDGKVFRQVRSLLFRELLMTCGGLDLWECAGTTRWERARLFWNQASLDSWRTCARAGLLQ